MFEPIVTNRLFIREIVEADVSLSYLAWLEDPEVNRFTEVRLQAITADYLSASIRKAREAQDEVFLGIFVREAQQHIGTIHITKISRHHQTGVIGFLIGEKRLWGKGLATEAITGVAEFLLNDFGLRKITAGCYEGNHGSVRALLKSGFVHETTRKHQLVVDTGPVDELGFAKFATGREPGES